MLLAITPRSSKGDSNDMNVLVLVLVLAMEVSISFESLKFHYEILEMSAK